MNNNLGVCDKTSNNKFFDCPPRMSDGRHFTDYRNTRYVNNMTRIQNDIQGSYNYRVFLQNNARKLMKVNRRYNQQKNGCQSCSYKVKSQQPLTLCSYNSLGPQCAPYDPNGLGMQSVANPQPMANLARLPAYVTHQGFDPLSGLNVRQ